MDPQSVIPAPEPPDVPAGAAVDAVGAGPTEAEADQAMLQRLAQICMDVAEAIGRQARADIEPADPLILSLQPVLSDATGGVEGKDAPLLRPSTAKGRREAANDGPAAPAPRLSPAELALAISRAARAVRMTLAFKAQLAAEGASAGLGAGLEAGEGAAGAGPNIKVRFVDRDDDVRAARKAELGAIVRRIAEAGVDDIDVDIDSDTDEAAAEREPLDPAEKAERVERLVREAAERLDEVETFGDLLARPFSEFVEQVCGLVGLSPDWARLAEEPWARAELAGGAGGDPLNRWRPPPSSPLEPYRASAPPPPDRATATSPPGAPSRAPSHASSSAPPAPPPDPQTPDPQTDEEARLAARTAERWRLAEYGPDGRGRPDY